MTISAIRLHAAEANVTVISNTPAVTDWSRRYVSPWWNAFAVPATSVCTGPLVIADVDPAQYVDLAAAVNTRPHQEVTYAKARTLVTPRDDHGVITAVCPGEGLAYRSEPTIGRLTIAGREAVPVSLAAARLAREMGRGQLLRNGWSLLHASAAARHGRAVLTFGSKGTGKTTTALLLASRGWKLLANDRVFVRCQGNAVKVLPWPSAASIGLGLLDALGWFDTTRKRLQAGEHLHPTQDQRVTGALLRDRRRPLWEKSGKRELKAQIFPDQFADWFGLTLATSGQAGALLFPHIDPGTLPAVADGSRTLREDDFLSRATEDRYPDIFGLACGLDSGGTERSRTAVTNRLAHLPHHTIVLGHDTTAAADFLTKLTNTI